MEKIYWFFYFFVRPKWWISRYPYSEKWDKKLTEILDIYKFSNIVDGVVKLGRWKIKITDHPADSFCPYFATSGILPARKTRKLAYDKLLRDLAE